MDPEVQKVIDYLSSKEYIEKRDRAILVFNERNIECDLNGHLNPNIKDNSCNYCYRRLEYYTSKYDSVTNRQKNLSNFEIGLQKLEDYFKGISKIFKGLDI